MIQATQRTAPATAQNGPLSPASPAPCADDDPDNPGFTRSLRRPEAPRIRVKPTKSSSTSPFTVAVAALVAFTYEVGAVPTLDHEAPPSSSAFGRYAPDLNPSTNPRLVHQLHNFVKRAAEKHTTAFIVQACFIPILVVLSGCAAGLTLAYFSQDTTQLQVLAKTGTPDQRRMAQKVLPLRKNGHLLLITLLIANMIFNETLPVIAENVMGGGIQAVIASTALIVVFSEIIPQTVCSRFGLRVGSAMALPTRIMITIFFVVGWPVAKLLEFLLGPHEGIVYRRVELKELVAMHAEVGGHGDLEADTVGIIGATLDLQAKVVRHAMTPLASVFSLPIDTRLDYETLGKILKAGHSRIPVYEDLPVEAVAGEDDSASKRTQRKIVGVLLTKQLILLDPEDAVPLRDIPLSSLPTVADDLPLLEILNTFQEGRSHIAAVHRFRRKASFPPRLTTIQSLSTDLERGDSAIKAQDFEKTSDGAEEQKSEDGGFFHKIFRKRSHSSSSSTAAEPKQEAQNEAGLPVESGALGERDAGEPVGIITLEDVIEELIGEEILDETDQDETHKPAMLHYVPPEAYGRVGDLGGPPPAPSAGLGRQPLQTKQSTLGGLARLGKGMVRARSVPGKERDASGAATPALSAGEAAPSAGQHQGAVAGALGWTSAAFGGRKRSASPAKQGTSASDPVAAPARRLSDQPKTPQTDSKRFLDEPAMMVDEPQAILATTEEAPANPSILRRLTATTPGATTPATGSTTPVLGTGFPLLSDAVLVERGRRKLVAQGADTANVTAANLRRAGAGLSQPPTRSSTPVGAFRDESVAGMTALPASTRQEGGVQIATRIPSGGGQSRQKGTAFKSLSTTSKPLPQEVRLGKPAAGPSEAGKTDGGGEQGAARES